MQSNFVYPKKNTTKCHSFISSIVGLFEDEASSCPISLPKTFESVRESAFVSAEVFFA